MFYSMANKCMTQWQKFSVFWQEVGDVKIYIVLINTTNQVRQFYIEESTVYVCGKRSLLKSKLFILS